jgi:AmiR/NasT family two-component response regulator
MSAAKPDMLDETIPDESVEPSASTEPNIVRIILADSQAIYRVGMRKIFALEDDIRVVAQVDNLQNLEAAIQRFPTDLVILKSKSLFKPSRQMNRTRSSCTAVGCAALFRVRSHRICW